jgi:hypothetical protein
MDTKLASLLQSLVSFIYDLKLTIQSVDKIAIIETATINSTSVKAFFHFLNKEFLFLVNIILNIFKFINYFILSKNILQESITFLNLSDSNFIHQKYLVTTIIIQTAFFLCISLKIHIQAHISPSSFFHSKIELFSSFIR